jgi:hypothetical protein
MPTLQESPQFVLQLFFIAQLAFPHNKYFPSECPQRALVLVVANSIRLKLWKPEIQSRFWKASQTTARALVPVPKATVDKYQFAQSREGKIRMPRQVSLM